jgi:predicted nucleic acid-binding protein
VDYTRVCFDSSVWNAIINRESHHDLISIEGWMTKIDSKKAKLLVPSIVVAELNAHPDQKSVQVFESYLLRSEVEQLDITTSIAKRAGQLRRRMREEGGLSIKLPDVLIVAAADWHRADLILSVDAGILRCDGQFELSPKIGRPNTGHNQPLLDNLD